MLKSASILITGGAGFLGSHLVEALNKHYPEANIIVIDNLSSGKTENLVNLKCDLRNIDIRDESKLKEVFKDVDIVFNLASQAFIPHSYDNKEGCISTNVNGSFNILEQCIKNNVKYVLYLSTSEVYGTARYTPIDEEHPVRPQSLYAATKLVAENFFYLAYKENGLPVNIIRSFNFYGPRDSHPRVIPKTITAFFNKKILELGNLESSRDFVYVGDVAEALIKSAEKNVFGKIINLGTNNEIKIKELVNKIANLMNVKNFELESKKELFRPFDVERLCGSNKRAKELLNWEPKTSLEEGLLKTIDWYKLGGIWGWERK